MDAFSNTSTSPFDSMNGSSHQFPYEDYEGYLYYYYYDHIYEIFDFETPLYGYVWPALVILTSCCNLLVIAAFLRKRLRTPMNAILISIAISDSLTGLVTLPATFHVFREQNELLTTSWCNVNMISRLYVSRAFHTVSIWQTLALGIQRYMSIRFPIKAQRWCTMRNTLISIGVIYLMAFVMHVYHAFNIKTVDGFCSWIIEKPCTSTCVYLWFALLFVHLLPGLFLLLLTVLMIVGVRRNVPEPFPSSSTPTTVSRREQQKKSMTVLVIVIVVIFLVPEIPYGIFYLVVVGQNHASTPIFPLRTHRLIHVIYDLLLVVSFHLNFWVYCLILPSFRACAKAVVRFVLCRPTGFSTQETNEGSDTSSNVIQMSRIEGGQSDVTN